MVEELLPGTVAVVTEVEVDQRIALGPDRLLNKGHVGLSGGAAPFLDVAPHTSTDDILPGRTASHATRHHVIQGQLAGGEPFATILTAVAVTSENIAPIEFHLAARQPIVKQQSNDTWHGDIELDGGNPVMTVRLKPTPELADLAPARKVVVGIGTSLERNHLRQIATQQGKSALGADDTDRHIVLVEHKHTAIQARMAFADNS